MSCIFKWFYAQYRGDLVDENIIGAPNPENNYCALSKRKILQYCDSNIELFSIAKAKSKGELIALAFTRVTTTIAIVGRAKTIKKMQHNYFAFWGHQKYFRRLCKKTNQSFFTSFRVLQ